MKNPSKRAESNGITPAVHLEFIQNQLENPKGSGAEEIEQYHRALFLHHHAEEWEKCRQIARTHEDRVAFLEGQLKDTEAQLGQRTKFVPVTVDGEPDSRPNTPWNAWDVAMFVACGLGIVALITFGVWNISFNLLESGLVTFRQNPIRSYLWAALLPVGALAVKIGWDFLQDKVKRDVYLGTCLTVGLIGVFVWVAAYAIDGFRRSRFPGKCRETFELRRREMDRFRDRVRPGDRGDLSFSGSRRLSYDLVRQASPGASRLRSCLSATVE